MVFTLYHIHDPMCSWCYAFKPTLDKLKDNLNSNIKIINVVGGLAPHSDIIMPKEQQNTIQNIWYLIEKEVGSKFNHDFWKNCKPRRSTYLSCQATMLARKYNKENEMIEAIQEAYYQKAMNPSDLSTLVFLAQELGIDGKEFQEQLISKQMQEDLEKELMLTRSLYVNAFPSLVLKYKKEIYPINIKFNEHKFILDQIENKTENAYF